MRRTIVAILTGVTIAGLVTFGSAPPAHADCAGGGGWPGGGAQCDDYLPNGDIHRCVRVSVFGFGGFNCFVIPKGAPGNP